MFFRGVDGVGIPPSSFYLVHSEMQLLAAGRVAGRTRGRTAVEKMGATCGIESEI